MKISKRKLKQLPIVRFWRCGANQGLTNGLGGWAWAHVLKEGPKWTRVYYRGAGKRVLTENTKPLDCQKENTFSYLLKQQNKRRK